MHLKALHIHGILSGSTTLITFLTAAVVLLHVVTTINNVEKMFLDILIGIICACALLVVASGLMIFGIVKKSPFFLLPWLVLMTLASITSCVFFFGVFLLAAHCDIKAFLVFISVGAINAMILYPIFALFFVLREARAGRLQLLD
ncbi:uncharacterized protein LOC142237714 isoform X1 [Haematobia irritans]|uniref:uncharacterized protein LOC142237714 isoform X1 n=1 Tax=Haematobia irritans TaxID=7368 RepID=UPI003F504988